MYSLEQSDPAPIIPPGAIERWLPAEIGGSSVPRSY